MTPHMEALAYRIWAYANPRGWKCSYAEIADGTDISRDMVDLTIRAKKWTGRVPKSTETLEGVTAMWKWKHDHGQNVDLNLLGVDQLMR